jgi:epoxyqueuosine reductase QueG
MKCENAIRNVIETECEDYYLGMVDLSRVENSIIEKYGSLIDQYPRAISIGITLPYMIPDELSSTKKQPYDVTNCQLKSITSHLSQFIEQEGYQALAMPKARKMSDGPDISFHEVVAHLADLGKIEKNLLVTPEVGSRVNWGTILTNAPI